MPLLRWSVVGASVQGSAHERQQIPCQDAHIYRALAGGQLIIAVADGAGSAKHADQGARFVVREAAALLEEAFAFIQPRDCAGWQDLFSRVFRRTYELLERFAHEHNAPVQAFAATLTLVMADEPWLVIGQVGDGLVVVRDDAGMLSLPVSPERGEYANETVFLTSEANALSAVCVAVQQPLTALAVSTDGLLRLALRLPTYQPFAPFFHPLFDLAADSHDQTQRNEQVAAWLGAEAVCARTDDDKTIVIAVRRAPLDSMINE